VKSLWILLFIVLSVFADNSANIEKIRKHISKTFLKTYANMHIDNISIKRYSNIPKEFEKYKLKKIYISENNLKRDKGTITVLFVNGIKKRKLHYHYKIDATVDVLRANQYIQAKKTITDDLVDFITIKFTNFYQKPITAYYLNRYRARTSLVEGKILTTRHVTKQTDVKRGDMLNTTLTDGGVVVTFQTQALKDAYIGDIIKVKRNHKSFFHVRVTSKNSAVVVE
jgi:flagella basal body P-ring formation protein FlgA